ncbi:MAG: hypothetical protein JWL83_2013 [Actinomycetia bacterium]|jgi:hypothetical protein|nr:hypothetical protein [Actinomycetes bacterium]
MARHSGLQKMGDLDVAGVIRVYAEQRRVAIEMGHPVCGEFLATESRGKVSVCSLARDHTGSHLSTILA